MKPYKQSQLRVYNNNGYKYIYVYYKEDNQTLRINTKFQYAKHKMTTDNRYNSKMKDHEKLNGHIDEIQWVVDTYINLMSGRKPLNQKECMKYVKENKYHASQVPASTVNKMTSLTDYLTQFIESKKNDPFLKTISLKNYTSFNNFLTDYQKYSNRKLFLFDMKKELVNKMITFSQVDVSGLKGYKTKGHLQQDTVKKRMDVFKEFLIWLADEDIATFNTHKLFPKIEKTTKEIIYITSEELQEVIAKRDMVTGDYNKVAYDSFIFNCECGLRYEDLQSLSKSDFIKIDDGYIIKKDLHKANQKFASMCQIPIVTPLLIEIIEQYDFHFKLKSNQYYNRTIKNLFKKHELFTEPLTVKRKYLKGEVEEEDLFKNDVITCHSCRRSMITNALMNDYNTAQVMQMSGHKNLRTLQKYTNFANDEILNKNLEQKRKKLEEE